MNPGPAGMFFQVQAPPRNFVFVADQQQLKQQIQKAEALAEAIWLGLPLFVPPDFFKAQTLEETTDRLIGIRNALRDFLCCELEQKLADQEANPLPTQEEIRAEMEKQMLAHPSLRPWVPTPDDLYKAQRQVEMLRSAIEKIEVMKRDDVPGWEMAEAALMPAYQGQLAQSEDYLELLHKKMDEAANSPMSNGTERGEGTVPDEAKP
jgi:hypothetical protein